MLSWASTVVEVAMNENDATSAAKALWKDWSATEEHVPWNLRARIVNMLDAKLHSRGYPSLRELISSAAGNGGGDSERRDVARRPLMHERMIGG